MELQIAILAISFFTLSILLPPVLDGIERKIKAKIQSRIGPPTLLQTWYDIVKLLSKELRVPRGAELVLATVLTAFIASICLVASLSYVISSITMEPLALALIIVLAIAVHTLSILIASGTSNPFALIGGFRAIALGIVNEVGLFMAISLAAYSAYIYAVSPSPKALMSLCIAIVMLLLSTYVASGRIPYDIHEAEPELAAGALIELGGPALGIYLYSHFIERFALKAIASYLILYPSIKTLGSQLFIIAVLGLTVLLYISYAILSAILGRTRVDLGVKFLLFSYSLTAILWVLVWLV